MGYAGFGAIGILAFACGCGGRAAQPSLQGTGDAGGAGPASSVGGDGSAGDSSGTSPDPTSRWDGGPMEYCSGGSSFGCAFTAADLPDVPSAERWGSITQWQQFPCMGSASCGDAMFAVDHAGCVTAAAGGIQSEFSACVLKYVEQFRWSCAADQHVRYGVSCTVR